MIDDRGVAWRTEATPATIIREGLVRVRRIRTRRSIAVGVSGEHQYMHLNCCFRVDGDVFEKAALKQQYQAWFHEHASTPLRATIRERRQRIDADLKQKGYRV